MLRRVNSAGRGGKYCGICVNSNALIFCTVGGVVKKTRKKDKQKSLEAPLPPLLAKNKENLLVRSNNALFFDFLIVKLHSENNFRE